MRYSKFKLVLRCTTANVPQPRCHNRPSWQRAARSYRDSMLVGMVGMSLVSELTQLWLCSVLWFVGSRRCGRRCGRRGVGIEACMRVWTVPVEFRSPSRRGGARANVASVVVVVKLVMQSCWFLILQTRTPALCIHLCAGIGEEGVYILRRGPTQGWGRNRRGPGTGNWHPGDDVRRLDRYRCPTSTSRRRRRGGHVTARAFLLSRGYDPSR
jgi:hypothetical protein